MSQETLVFEDIITKIDTKHNDLRVSEMKLRSFILSPVFLKTFMLMELLLGSFEDKVVTLVEAATMPVPGLEEKKEEAAETEKKEVESQLNLPKALVLVSANVASIMAVQQKLVPPILAIAVIPSSVVLVFLPQVREIVSSFLHRDELEEGKDEMESLDWITETISKIRAKYTSARFLVKIQSQTKESVPEYVEQGVDEALYDRTKYFNETLPSEFLSLIGRIMIACEKNVWVRKTFLINAIMISRQMAAQQKSG